MAPGERSGDRRRVTGFVRYVAESPSLATRTFQIEVEVANKDFLLRDGVSADLEVESSAFARRKFRAAPLHLMIQAALVFGMEGDVVAFREVAILSDQTEYSTVTGLGETEVVIIHGGDFTRAGQRVNAEIQTEASVKAAEAM
ncbi:MAG: hypothetical protein CM15mP21_1640 [Hyphomicrobiales bacterium]|nr:MAG: hypothetical protein CM15mP21_1640 [Hyphomicrobiales bacterium]